MTQKVFLSTKTFVHALGLSACFRQWRADSHCSFLHGYALQIKLTFAAPYGLDERNWVVDFGGLKEIKKWLEDTFDHKTVVAQDDPELKVFQALHERKIIDLIVVDAVGCEKFAELIFDKVDGWLAEQVKYEKRVFLATVEVIEHSGNSAICSRAANQGEEEMA